MEGDGATAILNVIAARKSVAHLICKSGGEVEEKVQVYITFNKETKWITN